MTDTMDMSALVEALPSKEQKQQIQQQRQQQQQQTRDFHCGNCELRYQADWYHRIPSKCFFCMRFPLCVTRYALLYETKWYFIQSGQEDPHTFYMTYFKLLHRWADRHRIPLTDREVDYQTYLVQFIDEP